jgi:hypothetical protein
VHEVQQRSGVHGDPCRDDQRLAEDVTGRPEEASSALGDRAPKPPDPNAPLAASSPWCFKNRSGSRPFAALSASACVDMWRIAGPSPDENRECPPASAPTTPWSALVASPDASAFQATVPNAEATDRPPAPIR